VNRAFIKDPDEAGVPEPPPERPQSPHANYVTPTGLRQLQVLLDEGEARRQRLLDDGRLASPQDLALVQRDLRYVAERLRRAILVAPGGGAPDRVHFGARVDVRDENGTLETFTIVGEDEADAALGKLSWVSPLAKALLNAELGELVRWRRPAGIQVLEIVDIRPGDPG
jgi:transcription elongation GreA/GreB family factor